MAIFAPQPELSPFAAFVAERLREKNLSLRRLSEMTGVSPRHLGALLEGRFDRLPPAPYVRNYLIRIGEVLEFDGQAWWERLKEEGLVRSSGPADELPKNRFARRAPPKVVWVVGIVMLIFLYFGLRSSNIFGTPRVMIAYPQSTVTVSNESEVIVRGTLANGDKVSVNGESVPVERGGVWEKRISLQPGLNTVEVHAEKFLGKGVTLVRQILYEPAPLPISTATSSPR